MSDDRNPRREPPPVEPLGDVSWARIERSVWAELDAAAAPAPAARVRSRRTLWIGVGGAIAAAAAVVIIVATVRGSQPGPAPSPQIASGAPQWVVTDVGASAVTFGDARIRVAPQSAVVMNGTAEGGVLIVIDRGAAEFEVAPRAGRPRFVVQAGEVSVRVIGTAFRVERVGDRAKVAVTHGTVEVVAPGETARVTAGETWPAETAAAAAPNPNPSPGPNPSPIASSPTAVDRTKHAAPPPQPPAAATPDEAHRFAAAAEIEAGDPTAALAEYRRLASGDGPWAANALYAAARLLYDRRDDASARAALADYLHRFPRGANSADARALMDRLQGAHR